MDLGGGVSSGSEFEYKRIVWALIILVVMPILMPLMCTPVEAESEWADEISDIENTYYRQSGVGATADINIWALTGIYTPYEGGQHGYTDDGWLYGDLIESNAPSQYDSNPYWANEKFRVDRASNGLYYYSTAPTNSPDITTKTVYSAVTMDQAHKSDVFFTTSGKTTEGEHYYYAYTGYRYAFQPLSNYTTTKDGTTYEIDSKTSSCSLIWYQYQSLDGISGQLTVSSRDYGVSYLDSEDVIRAYDSVNLTARFDMYFGNLPMHLLIRLNPYAVASGLSVPEIWNNGYWSVMVYSDQDATTTALSQNYELSPTKILETVIALFTFDVTEKYQIEGWVGVLASMVYSLSFYAVLLAVALNHAYLWILVGVLAAIQSMKFW